MVCLPMVWLPKMSGGMGVNPFSIGMVCNMKGGSQGNVVHNHSGSMLEVVGSDGGLGWNLNRGVVRGKQQSSREMSDATKVIDGKGDKGNDLCI
jgi:hypothetical protein